MIDITIKTDNTEETKEELHRLVEIALALVGERAEGYAKDNCPVDTGRLRNSITYATKTKTGSGTSATKAQPETNTVYIGSNVEYAPEQELIDMHHKVGRAHFLRDAATTHGDEYENIIETVLKD